MSAEDKEFYKDAFEQAYQRLSIDELFEWMLEDKLAYHKAELGKVDRVEVIDEKGRSYVNWKPTNKVELSYQDDNRTLKVFITQKLKQ